jgi:hypothetical protein
MCFGETCRLHLQGQICQARNQHEADSMILTFNGLHGVIYEIVELSITSAVKTSNPTDFIIFAVQD